MIDPVAISRWITVLRKHFPGFTAFDPPSADFDQAERNYKLKTRDLLLRRLEGAASDMDRLDAVHAALSDSNLLQWRAYWSISPKGDADCAAAASAISALVEATSGDPEGHPAAVATFIRHWMETLPNPQRDHARQVAGFVLMHLNPDNGIYFRRTLLDALYREANGNAFPRSDDPAVEYAEERSFAQRVESAFRDQGLALRDLIDVQSALWVVFNYDSKVQKERSETDAMEKGSTEPRALNTILYGPPGTGKTFLTAQRSVEICDGSTPPEEEIRARYNELVRQKRIEFVTFHQTYGYEEFVEGLRPDTGLAEDSEEDAGPGFRLKSVDGVLKRIAERARKLPASTGKTFDPTGRRVFKISLGRSNFSEDSYLRDECLENGYVLLGYGGEIDWSNERFRTFEENAARWRQEPEQNDARGNNPNIMFLNQLRNMMREGDIVMAVRGEVGLETPLRAKQTRRGAEEHRKPRRQPRS